MGVPTAILLPAPCYVCDLLGLSGLSAAPLFAPQTALPLLLLHLQHRLFGLGDSLRIKKGKQS